MPWAEFPLAEREFGGSGPGSLHFPMRVTGCAHAVVSNRYSTAGRARRLVRMAGFRRRDLGLDLGRKPGTLTDLDSPCDVCSLSPHTC